MTDHRTGTHEEWLAARLELLDAEKELTRRGDELARLRQDLPWVPIEKEYRFETDEGTALSSTSSKGARSCSSTTSCSGPTSRPGVRPARRSPTASPVGGAPRQPRRRVHSGVARAAGEAAGLQAADGLELSVGVFVRERLQLRLSRVPHREEWQSGAVEYNFRSADFRPSEKSPFLIEIASGAGTDPVTFRKEGPGMSAFVLEDGVVFHTYSAYGRGVDGLWGMYSWLDRAPRGRNESGMWWRRHDEYEGG